MDPSRPVLPSLEQGFRRLAHRLALQLSLLVALAFLATGIVLETNGARREMDVALSAIWPNLERLVAVGDRFSLRAELAAVRTSGAIHRYELRYRAEGAADEMVVASEGPRFLEREPDLENAGRLYLPFGALTLRRQATLPMGGTVAVTAVRQLDLLPFGVLLLLAAGLGWFAWVLGRGHLDRLARKVLFPIRSLSAALSSAATHRELDLHSFSTSYRELAAVTDAFRDLRRRIDEFEEKQLLLERKTVISEIAAQVAHDIRSPTTVLKMLAGDGSDLRDEERRLLHGVVARIHEIAETLQQAQHATPAAAPREERAVRSDLVFHTLQSLLDEKRREYADYEGLRIDATFGEGVYATSVAADGGLLKRILSNLVDNAVQAMKGRGTVAVHVALVAKGKAARRAFLDGRERAFGADLRLVERLRISVRDEGPGVADEIFPRLTEEGATFGKDDGHGLGLSSARKNLERWGGRLEVSSVSARGAEFALELRLLTTPAWVAPSVDLPTGSIVAVVDDDERIHTDWARLLAPSVREKKIEVVHLRTVPEAARWFAEKAAHPSALPVRVLCDYDFRDPNGETGLDLLGRFQLGNKALLVTNRFDDERLQARCEREGVRVVPKVHLSSVPIHFL